MEWQCFEWITEYVLYLCITNFISKLTFDFFGILYILLIYSSTIIIQCLIFSVSNSHQLLYAEQLITAKVQCITILGGTHTLLAKTSLISCVTGLSEKSFGLKVPRFSVKIEDSFNVVLIEFQTILVTHPPINPSLVTDAVIDSAEKGLPWTVKYF